MKAFICSKRPRSVNAKKTETFKNFISQAYVDYCGTDDITAPAYSRVYYFRNVAHQLDADNLSKPVLDALQGIAYDDDSIVKLRHSGIVDLTIEDISGFDVSGIPDNVLPDFLEKIGTEDHVIYVEIGPLALNMYKFGLDSEERP